MFHRDSKIEFKDIKDKIKKAEKTPSVENMRKLMELINNAGIFLTTLQQGNLSLAEDLKSHIEVACLEVAKASKPNIAPPALKGAYDNFKEDFDNYKKRCQRTTTYGTFSLNVEGFEEEEKANPSKENKPKKIY